MKIAWGNSGYQVTPVTKYKHFRNVPPMKPPFRPGETKRYNCCGRRGPVWYYCSKRGYSLEPRKSLVNIEVCRMACGQVYSVVLISSYFSLYRVVLISEKSMRCEGIESQITAVIIRMYDRYYRPESI